MFLKVYYSNPILPLTLCKKSVLSDLSRSSLKNLLEMIKVQVVFNIKSSRSFSKLNPSSTPIHSELI